MNLQEFYLQEALKEQLKLNLSYKTDHASGFNYINNIKIPLTFPRRMLDFISKIKKTKKIDYCFIGSITQKRNWVKDYNKNSIIIASDRGRDNSKKFNLDEKYYQTLCQSKFCLSPTGDCNWSYRFFEAIMCYCIPIVEDNSLDVFKDDYIYFYNNQTHTYTEKAAYYNYQKFLSSKHFLSNVSI